MPGLFDFMKFIINYGWYLHKVNVFMPQGVTQIRILVALFTLLIQGSCHQYATNISSSRKKSVQLGARRCLAVEGSFCGEYRN